MLRRGTVSLIAIKVMFPLRLHRGFLSLMDIARDMVKYLLGAATEAYLRVCGTVVER
jgi:hypothetical protein